MLHISGLLTNQKKLKSSETGVSELFFNRVAFIRAERNAFWAKVCL